MTYQPHIPGVAFKKLALIFLGLGEGHLIMQDQIFAHSLIIRDLVMQPCVSQERMMRSSAG